MTCFKGYLLNVVSQEHKVHTAKSQLCENEEETDSPPRTQRQEEYITTPLGY